MIAVLLKELLENLRDRRVVLNSLVISPLAAPLIFVAVVWFTFQQGMERAAEQIELPVVGAEHAPNLVAWLKQQDVRIQPSPANPVSAVRNAEVDLVLELGPDFAEHWDRGDPAGITLIVDQSRRFTGTTLNRVQQLLSGYGEQISQLRLQLRGVAPTLIEPLSIRTRDVSTPAARGSLVLAFLPYVVMLTVFIGAMHMAIDTTAGERERRSLEPLLLTPLPRWQILLGKLLATSLFALASLAIGLTAFTLALQLLPTAPMNMTLNLDAGVALRLFLLMLPVAVAASALLTILAAFAKSYREAQSYLGLVLFLPMIPSFWIFLAPDSLQDWMNAVPLLGQSKLMLELVRGEAPAASALALTTLTTSLLALALIRVAASLYNRPGLIFTDA